MVLVGFVVNFLADAAIQVGDVLAVRVCSRFAGWVNYAKRGYVMARVLKEGMYTIYIVYQVTTGTKYYLLNTDLFIPHRWTLASEVIPSLEDAEDGSYSFVSTTPCFVKATGNELSSKIWFTTPVRTSSPFFAVLRSKSSCRTCICFYNDRPSTKTPSTASKPSSFSQTPASKTRLLKRRHRAQKISSACLTLSSSTPLTIPFRESTTASVWYGTATPMTHMRSTSKAYNLKGSDLI